MNVSMILDMAADGQGDRIAIGSRRGGLTYAELRQAARAGSHALLAGGHDTLAMAEPSGPVVPVALFAAAWAGASYAPLNYRLPPSTLAEALGHLPSPLLVGDESLGGTTADEWLAKLPASVDLEESAAGYPEEPDHPAVLLAHQRYLGGTEDGGARSRQPAVVHLQHR